MSFRQKHYTSRKVLAAAVTSLAVFSAAALANDTIFPDGDSDAAHPSPNLAYGTGDKQNACSTRGSAVAGDVTVNYNGNGLDTDQHFSPNESLSVTLTPAPGSGITTALGPVPNVPATWGGDQSDHITIPFTTTVPSSLADGSYQVDVTVRGLTSGYSAGDGEGSGRPQFIVNISCGDGGGGADPNVAPTISWLDGADTAIEGDVKSYSFAIADTDVGDTYAYAAGSPYCGLLGSISGTPTITSTGGSFSCTFPDGVIPAQTSNVSVQVTDEDLSNTLTRGTKVSNANPVVSALSTTGNNVVACTGANPVSMSYSFTDAGLVDDPWATDVNWGDASAHTTGSVSSQGAQGPLSHNYGAGVFTAGATVTDKDGGAGSNAAGSGATITLLYSSGAGILQPINYTGPRSAFKIGSTIPVKVKITDCNGAPVSGLTLTVGMIFLDGTPDGTAVEEVVSTVPDQGTTMRYTGAPDNQYIYNMATKGRAVGDYKVTVTGATIAPISANLSLKK